jgi:hypothetical protein
MSYDFPLPRISLIIKCVLCTSKRLCALVATSAAQDDGSAERSRSSATLKLCKYMIANDYAYSKCHCQCLDAPAAYGNATPSCQACHTSVTRSRWDLARRLSRSMLPNDIDVAKLAWPGRYKCVQPKQGFQDFAASRYRPLFDCSTRTDPSISRLLKLLRQISRSLSSGTTTARYTSSRWHN